MIKRINIYKVIILNYNSLLFIIIQYNLLKFNKIHNNEFGYLYIFI
jgi:hypothetical protein